MQLTANMSHSSGSQSSHSSEQPPVHAYPSTHDIMSAEGSSEPPNLAKPKPHQCQICGRGFTTGGHLQRHQRIHTGVKAFKCPFPGCETRTSRQDNLQQHYRTHLSPSIRRGSGSAARAAVARAMEEAGIRPTASSRQRKAKSATASSSSSSTHTSAPPSMYGGASGHSTPSYGSGAYSAYEPLPPGGSYPSYSLQHTPSVSGFATPSSASSSRVPSPANGHPAYFGQSTASYPQPAAYGYGSQQAGAYYTATPIQPPFAQARMYAPTAVYSPINPSNFDGRSSSYPSLLPSAYAGSYASRQTPTSQHDTSRQSSIEPQNAAQAYSYHTQRQHSTSSLHSDYQRGAASTQSPPASRRITPPAPSAAIDPAAARPPPSAQLAPSPATPAYPSYVQQQQQQQAAAQRAFSDTYASQHSQSQRLYETDRFGTAPVRKRLAYEEENSNSGDEAQARLSAPAPAPALHAYTQPEPRYQTASPIVSLTQKHAKEMAPEWAVERRVW